MNQDRFWAKVNKTDTCWLWTGYQDRNGYGRFGNGGDGNSTFAHRLAYQSLVGPIPDGLTIDHLCRTRACVNPGHMEPVTAAVNRLRGDKGGRPKQTHCKRGHEFTDANTYRPYGPNGPRNCRACAADRDREHRAIRRHAAQVAASQSEGTRLWWVEHNTSGTRWRREMAYSSEALAGEAADWYETQVSHKARVILYVNGVRASEETFLPAH